MRYDILFVLLNLCVSIADFLPTAENECKPNVYRETQEKISDTQTRVTYALKRYVACRHDLWSRSNADKTKFDFKMRPKSADFDEDSGKLDLFSWVAIVRRNIFEFDILHWDYYTEGNHDSAASTNRRIFILCKFASEERLKWDRKQFGRFSTIFKQPDLVFINIGTDDIYERSANRTECHLFWDGDLSCAEDMHQTIRCETDMTLWPYDRYTCTMIITSWFFTAEELTLSNKSPAVDMSNFKSDGKWNLSFSRITEEQRKSFFNENVIYPQITIEFILERLHTRLTRRFVAPAVIMMIMTLTALWLEPKSYERLAVASLNIIIHMVCIQDLHWVLPRNGITVPNMLLFYINSFVLATVVLPLTFLLGKINDTKTSAPKWISSSIDRLLKTKAGHILLLVMLDSKVLTAIETSADENSGLSSSEPKKCTWKYMAIFVGWISFFSFFSAYILMYILLIPNSASRPPIMSIV